MTVFRYEIPTGVGCFTCSDAYVKSVKTWVRKAWWLTKPNLPQDDEYEFWFTEKGNEKFIKSGLIGQYIVPLLVKTKTIRTNSKGICYKDEFQIAMRINKKKENKSI